MVWVYLTLTMPASREDYVGHQNDGGLFQAAAGEVLGLSALVCALPIPGWCLWDGGCELAGHLSMLAWPRPAQAKKKGQICELRTKALRAELLEGESILPL